MTSSTGYGDGGYDILRVLDPAGENRGVEVVFLSPTIDRAVEAATAHVPCPAAEDRAAYYRDEATAEVKAQMEAWYAAQREETAAAWEKLVTSIDPAADGLIPQVVGTLTVTGDHGDPAWGTVELGDPCYGSPTRVLPVPAGTYTAVAWVTTAEDDRWGDRVARLGVYRAGAA